jgi:flagellar FliL protein
MATSKPAKAGAAPANGAKKSKAKLFIIIGAVLALVLGGGAAAWYFLGHKNDDADQEEAHAAPKSKGKAKVKASAPPVFQSMDPYTVNLQPGENGDQYLQTSITLQLAKAEDVEILKTYQPQIRSRILMLLSSKHGAELASVEGKKKLADEIMALFEQPFSKGGPAVEVTDVLFTAFVIQ